MATIDRNLLREVKVLTKRANQRLRQLEKSGVSQQSKAYRYVKRLVFDKQINNIVDVTNKGEPKFKTSFSNLSNRQLKQQLREVETFLQAKTSTVRSVKKAYEKAYKTYSRLYNDNLTFEEYSNLFDESSLAWYSKTYGSKELNKLVLEQGENKSIAIANRVKQTYEDRKKLTGVDKDISFEEIEKIKKDLFRGDDDGDWFNMG